MKMFRQIMLVAGAVLLLAILLASTSVNLQQSRLDSEARSIRQSFIERDMPIREEIPVDATTQPDFPGEESSASQPDAPEHALGDNPPPLEHVLDRSVLHDLINKKHGWDYWEPTLALTVLKITRVFPVLDFGEDPSAFDLGMHHLELGDLNKAKAYFWQEVDSEHDDNRFSSQIRLAYLEEDPRVVEKLLYRSCEGNHLRSLVEAVIFCDTTGSDALKEYYVRRLYTAYPEEAAETMKRFDD